MPLLIVHLMARLAGIAINHPWLESRREEELNYGLRAALASIPMLLMLTATPCALADGNGERDARGRLGRRQPKRNEDGQRRLTA